MAPTGTKNKDDHKELRERLEAALHHLIGCPEERTETYELKGPNGYVVVSRCQDCGAHDAQPPTDEPTLD